MEKLKFKLIQGVFGMFLFFTIFKKMQLFDNTNLPSFYNLVTIMAKHTNIIAFSPLIMDTLMYHHIHRYETQSKKSDTDDGIRKNIVSSLSSIHNIKSLSIHQQENRSV